MRRQRRTRARVLQREFKHTTTHTRVWLTVFIILELRSWHTFMSIKTSCKYIDEGSMEYGEQRAKVLFFFFEICRSQVKIFFRTTEMLEEEMNRIAIKLKSKVIDQEFEVIYISGQECLQEVCRKSLDRRATRHGRHSSSASFS